MRIPGQRAITITQLELIDTPNKNVQCYFLKTDNTNYTREKTSYKNYVTVDDKSVQALILQNKIQILDKKIEILNFFDGPNLKTEEEKIGFETMLPISNIFAENIKNRRNMILVVAFQDWLNKFEIYELLNSFYRIQIKAILPVTHSMCVAVGRGINFCLVVHVNENYQTVAMVDDFCVIDNYKVDYACKGLKSVDGADFVDNFVKKGERVLLKCNFCGVEDNLQRIGIHLKEKHEVLDVDENVIVVEIEKQVKKLDSLLKEYVNTVSLERSKKTKNILICKNSSSNEFLKVKTSIEKLFKNYENVKIFEVCDFEETAMKGLKMIDELEGIKQFYVTDVEWFDFGVRILKDKKMFNWN